jgi:hypothetical protein
MTSMVGDMNTVAEGHRTRNGLPPARDPGGRHPGGRQRFLTARRRAISLTPLESGPAAAEAGPETIGSFRSCLTSTEVASSHERETV